MYYRKSNGQKSKVFTELPTDGFDHCVICGNKTTGYAFCRTCWNNYDEKQLLKILNHQTEQQNLSTENEKAKVSLNCLICGKPSNGKHFCVDCYKKYANKTITVNLINLSTIEILDNYGNKKIKTVNGTYVRSQQEVIIFNELYRRKIRFVYEKTFSYKDEKGEIKQIHPDFYLPDYDLYIEHWGYTNSKDPSYLREKAYKEKIYKNQHKQVEGTSTEDLNDIEATIDRILLKHDIPLND